MNIASRYLFSKKTPLFQKMLVAVALTGMVISVCSFVVIHSVMYGFSSYLRSSLTGFHSHLTVENLDNSKTTHQLLTWLEAEKEVHDAFEVLEFDAIIETESKKIPAGVRVRGMTQKQFEKWQSSSSDIQVNYYEGEESSFLKGSEEDLPGIILGEELLTRLKLYYGFSETLRLINPFGDVGPTGEMEPRLKDFRVIGTLSSGTYDADGRYVFILKDEASFVVGDNKKAQKIQVSLKHPMFVGHFKKKIVQNFSYAKVQTWEELNQRLVKALAHEKIGMFFLLVVVTFLACLNVYSLMTLISIAKLKEAALLRTLGFSQKKLRNLFLKMGFLLGGAGTIIGLVFSALILVFLIYKPIGLPSAYYLQTLPVKVDYLVLLVVSLIAPCFCALVSLGSALKVSRVSPREVMSA